MINRRTLLRSTAGTATLVALGVPLEALADNRVKFGKATVFSSETLFAQTPYKAQPTAPCGILEKIDCEAHD